MSFLNKLRPLSLNGAKKLNVALNPTRAASSQPLSNAPQFPNNNPSAYDEFRVFYDDFVGSYFNAAKTTTNSNKSTLSLLAAIFGGSLFYIFYEDLPQPKIDLHGMDKKN